MFIKRIKTTVSFSFKVVHNSIKLISGIWKLSKLSRPTVAIFGSARLNNGNKYLEQAELISKELVKKGFTIISGGNSGIMEAAAKGATEAATNKKLVTMGVGVYPMENAEPSPYIQPNKYVKKNAILMPTLFSRKILLTRFSDAFVVFPGGFGTMDELFEMLQLIQTKRIKRTPIVLMGSDYWNPLVQRLKEIFLAGKFIKKEDVYITSITDDIDKAIKIIMKNHSF
jgi:uncharacterized protein (TIGR00730 family)